jgi:hypothetical protein
MASELKRTAGYPRTDAVKRATVSTALEGGRVDAWQLERLRKYQAGEISATQLVARSKRAARRFA